MKHEETLIDKGRGISCFVFHLQKASLISMKTHSYGSPGALQRLEFAHLQSMILGEDSLQDPWPTPQAQTPRSDTKEQAPKESG